MKSFLKFILPNGSLGPAFRKYLEPEYVIPQPDRTGFCGTVNGIDFYQLDRRTIPRFLETEYFDAGITGSDLLLESGVECMDVICEVPFSRASERPTRWVLAKLKDFVRPGPRQVRIGCELLRFAAIILERANLDFAYDIVPISGSEEQQVKFHVLDMVFVVTESGSSIDANLLDIIPGCEEMFVSVPMIIARRDISDEAREKLYELSATLRSSVGARSRIMVLCDLPSQINLEELHLPSSVTPTIVEITKEWKSFVICIPLTDQGRVLVLLERNGAKGIVVQSVQGYLP
ncbi:hypothetical protein A3C37_01445 [Candidatus Peribacteria bacterium RIFCSPHIGHO2_02_FULL_53_20]|nr:MAG: hypothetical protein A3C37_01445 [Candidatus Peribacteria bacterium RIFCSPHIGHO2_02_FULL_53_20]